MNQSFSASSLTSTNPISEPPATVLHVAESAEQPRALSRNEKKYQKLLDDYLGPASGLIILILCLFVYRFSLSDSEQIASHLAMNQEEQNLIIPPLAAWMDKQQWPEETRDRILQSGDIIGLTLGFSSYGSRVFGALRELRGQIGNSRHAVEQTPAASNGHQQPDGGIVWGNALAGFSQYSAN